MNTQRPGTHIAQALRNFIKLESAGGTILLLTAIAALVIANSPLSSWYDALIDTPVAVQIGALVIDKPLLLWVNDGLMAVFFFLIGLEVKREFLEGELSSASQVVLPAVGALGGMVAPALFYAVLNWNDAVAMDGWAIPVATDIAFALALLSVFGSRVPITLKVFLLSVAIFDDLAAIGIIAVFYSDALSLTPMLVGGAALLIAVAMNRLGITRTSPYILVGVVLWAAVLKSGVHATLAGVLIALCIPMRDRTGQSPLLRLEHDLHGPVALVILPVFAFANAGLSLTGLTVSDLTHPVTLGVLLGLLVGKPIGIMGFVGAAIALGLARRPVGVSWSMLLGVSFACGIGFTMSLFIAGLAFEHGSGAYFIGDRLGILVGSVLAAVCAYALLHLSLPARSADRETDAVPRPAD